MPRGSSAYRTAATAAEITTAWLVAIPSLPVINDPSTTIELFFTDFPGSTSPSSSTSSPAWSLAGP